MFFLLFGFWVLLNGSFTLEIAITGAVVCGLIWLFAYKFMGYSPRAEWKLVKRFFRILGYGIWLVGEILRSAFAVMKLIWSPATQVEPQLVGVRSRLRTEAGRVVLADSITLTPGTVTVAIQDDRLLVHGLDCTLTEGMENSEMERRIAHVEGGSQL